MSRFTIELSDQADAEIEHIRDRIGAQTKADVIRKALSLLNYVVQERENGGRLVVENTKQNLRKEVVTL